jgi:hypothetical protein
MERGSYVPFLSNWKGSWALDVMGLMDLGLVLFFQSDIVNSLLTI